MSKNWSNKQGTFWGLGLSLFIILNQDALSMIPCYAWECIFVSNLFLTVKWGSWNPGSCPRKVGLLQAGGVTEASLSTWYWNFLVWSTSTIPSYRLKTLDTESGMKTATGLGWSARLPVGWVSCAAWTTNYVQWETVRSLVSSRI